MPGCSPTDLLPLLSFSPSHEDSLLGEGPLERPGARLCLTDEPLRTAVKCRYGKRLGLESTAHFLIAAQLWKTCDPDASGTFRSCPPEALGDLPYHLVSPHIP